MFYSFVLCNSFIPSLEAVDVNGKVRKIRLPSSLIRRSRLA
jgi:hypothetical protein